MRAPRRSTDNALPTRKTGRRSAQVPAQLFGYSLQATRLLQLLLDAPTGSCVSLEVFEDVGVDQSDGRRVASQVKSGLVKNPLADRSTELWKTLANWCDAIERGDLNPSRTTFEIYVARPRKGRIASLFHDAQSPESVRRAITEARNSFAKNRSPRSGNGRPTEASAYANRVFAAQESSLGILIQNFRITTAKRDPLSDLRPAVAAKWVRPESLDLVIDHAHGWIKERLDELLLARMPASIGADEFNREMQAFLPRCDFRTMIMGMAGLPSPEQVAAERIRTYVRQLEIIDLDEETTLQAINEYLRASVTRTKLSEAGIVHDDSFIDYQEALTSFWRNKRRKNSLTFPQHMPEDLGQLLLSDCCLHQQRLQGLELPAYFTPGSFHALADDETVGWHPEYQTKLKGAEI